VDFTIDCAPAFWELDLFVPSGLVELIKVPVGDWSPVDPKLPNLDLSLRMLVIPPEFMIFHFLGAVVVLRVIMTQNYRLRAQRDRRGRG
jgi:hypothetical protein